MRYINEEHYGAHVFIDVLFDNSEIRACEAARWCRFTGRNAYGHQHH